MKTAKKKTVSFICLAVIGAAMTAIGFSAKSSALEPLGIGLFAVSIVKIIQYARIMSNKERAKKFDMMQNEERLVLIVLRSSRLAFVISVLGLVAASTALMILGNESIGTLLCNIAAIQVAIYLVCTIYFNKKY